MVRKSRPAAAPGGDTSTPVSRSRAADPGKSARPDESYHHGDLRRALIREAIALLDEQGNDGVTLRELARRAGVSSAAPYRHFSDKRALLDAIAYEGFQRLQQYLDDALKPSTLSRRDRLLAVLVAYTRFGANHRQHARVMFGTVVKERSAELEALAKATFARLVEAVANALSGQGVVEAEPTRIALLLWAQSHGLMQLSENVDFGELSTGMQNDEVIAASLEQSVDALIPEVSPASARSRRPGQSG